jgi:hypothetical protein
VTDARLRIERLVVRVRGMDEARARSLASGLGPGILRHLAPAVSGAAGGRVERVDAGTVAFTGGEQAAAAVAAAIAARLPGGEES